MKEGHKRIILYGVAGIFLLTVVLIIFLHLQQKLYWSLFWVCYSCMALISLGIITKKPNLILSQIIILLIPDLFWIIDFIILLVTGNSLLGFAKYFFTGERALLQNILSLQHFFAVPLAIFALSLMKIKKNYKFFLISFVEIIFFFLLSFIIPAGYGVNCLPTPEVCTSVIFPRFMPYPFIWLILIFLFMIISYFILSSFIFIKKNTNKN